MSLIEAIGGLGCGAVSGFLVSGATTLTIGAMGRCTVRRDYNIMSSIIASQMPARLMGVFGDSVFGTAAKVSTLVTSVWLLTALSVDSPAHNNEEIGQIKSKATIGGTLVGWGAGAVATWLYGPQTGLTIGAISAIACCHTMENLFLARREQIMQAVAGA